MNARPEASLVEAGKGGGESRRVKLPETHRELKKAFQRASHRSQSNSDLETSLPKPPQENCEKVKLISRS